MTRPRHVRAASRRLFALALALAIGSSAWPLGDARAVDDSNIPGTPLPGFVVTGQLGGAIYDHVYSIDVPASSLILLSLTGDPGTDFDLYLFDAGATTVYTTNGQVAASTGGTSTESITYSSPGGGHYYIDLNGATDVQGQFRLVVSIAADAIPPVATLQLNGGEAATNVETVTAVVVGTDNLSGVARMQLSTDGATWGPWVPYSPTFLWTFPVGDGVKQLWARVDDHAGNVSNVATATIELDTTGPQVTARDPGPNGIAAGLRATFTVTFDEPIQPATWVDQGLVVQRADGTPIPGAYEWRPNTNTGAFTPTTAMIAGEQLVVTLGAVRDLAGNPLGSLGTWTVTPLLKHTVSVAANPAVVVSGGSTSITGQIDGPVIAQLTLEASQGGSSWLTVGAVRPDSSGAFANTVPVSSNTMFRVHVGRSQTEADFTTDPVRVLVRRKVELVGTSATTTRSGSTGRLLSLTARVAPTTPNVTVTFTVQRYDPIHRRYVVTATSRRTTSNGRAAFSWRPGAAGSYRVLLSTPSSATFANGISPIYRWTIT